MATGYSRFTTVHDGVAIILAVVNKAVTFVNCQLLGLNEHLQHQYSTSLTYK